MKRLRSGEPEYRALLGDGQDAVFVMAAGVEDCNEAACRLLACTRERLIGRSPLDFSPPLQPDGAPSAEAGSDRARSALAGLPQSFRWQFRASDGSEIACLVDLEAIELDRRKRLLLRASDLSRLWRAESALRESETRLQQILDNTAAVVFAKDLEGRYLFANREFQRLARQPAEGIVGRSDRELWPPDVAERFRRNDLQVCSERRTIEFEETLAVGRELRTYLAFKFPLLATGGGPYAVCGIATDISDRKRVESALRHVALAVTGAGETALFEDLARHMASILDVDIAFIAVYPQDRRMLRTLALCVDGAIVDNLDYPLAGTPCETVVGRQFRFFPSGIQSAFPGDGMFPALGVVGYAAYPLNDSGGQPLGLVAVMSRRPLAGAELIEAILKIFATRVANEIERMRAEDAQRLASASYRAIFEAGEDALFVHDFDTGAIIDVNPKACEIYGWSPEEMRRLTVADLSSGVPPYTADEAARLMRQAQSGIPQRFEWQRRNRDGSLHWDEVVLKKAVIAGQPRILAVTREITERKFAEQALRAREEQYRAIFDAAADGLALWNADAVVVDANPAYLRMHGYAREELLGMDGAALLPPDLRPHYRALVDGVLAGAPCGREIAARRRDGTQFDAEIHGVPMRYRDQPHVLVMLRDITERRRADAERAQLEAQLRQAQKMEAIGHLTGGIAHDFNNILTGVMGYIGLAAERPAAGADARLAGYLEQANRSCRRARDLIQQMLTFSRGRRGEPRPLSLPTLVRESVKLLRPSLPSSIELGTQLDEEVPAVRLDPVHAEQVLMNLCINARDAIGGSGRIDIAVRRAAAVDALCASCRQPVRGDFVELAVRDTGPGIPPQVFERMFEPFFTTKEVGRGSGMGLATVHGIVHEYSGHIVVDGAAGRGACFRVLFPPLPERIATDAPTAGAPSAARGSQLHGQVLVVDDEDTVGEFLRELLENWGLGVTLRRDGAEARATFAADPERYDLVITDQTMPQVTGLELARELVRLKPGLPVILFTGYSEDVGETDLAAAGVLALVRKPVEPPALLALLQTRLATPAG